MADEPMSELHGGRRGIREFLLYELVGNGSIAEIGLDPIDEEQILRAGGAYRDQKETVVHFPADDECARHVPS